EFILQRNYSMEIRLKYLENTYTVKLEKEKDRNSYKIIINDREYKVDEVNNFVNSVQFRLNNELFIIFYAEEKGRKYIAVDGEYYVFEPEKSEKLKSSTTIAEKTNIVVSPMPGLLVKVPVKIGDKVSAGTTLAIVEAMKMQNELRASRDGVVKKINYKEGEQVDAFVPIVELE
ncbi:MAG: acetyl-CoA carboxylase biotin carboxyl carrier protein subunit, partial [candidate division WOR-3 bacterium]|nr:acetyl-CoA carboxylase biotin carboxyl carrier protein subunit [candidate division WOR-3 bacterium]